MRHTFLVKSHDEKFLLDDKFEGEDKDNKKILIIYSHGCPTWKKSGVTPKNLIKMLSCVANNKKEEKFLFYLKKLPKTT